jgi:predicted CXXCH cytochrome family protein
MTKGLLVKGGKAFCFECHDDFLAKSKFKHAPDENGECLSCHSPHGSNNKFMLAKAGKANCFECHDDFLEKAKFKHSVVEDCSSCHSPHKAVAPKLLVKAPQDLCYECHEQKDMLAAKGHANIAGKQCITCHDVHAGENKFLVKPAARTQAAKANP